MRSLVMFFGSCGHVDLTEVTDEQWTRVTTIPPSGPLGRYEKNRFKVGRRTRIAYVYPTRFCMCLACCMTEHEDNLRSYGGRVRAVLE